MGRILRRFARFHEMDFVGKVVGGTWAVPITQELAGPEHGIQVVKTATALGGEVTGSYSGVRASANRVGDILGARVRATVNTNVLLTGGVWGQRTEVEVLGTVATVSAAVQGHCIEIYSEAGCVITGDVRGLYISNYNLGTLPMTYEMIRVEENGTAVPISAFSAYAAPDVTYSFIFSGAKSGWNSAGDRIGAGAPNANAAGFLRLSVGGVVRYIQLFT